MAKSIPTAEYESFQRAYDIFNRTLFDGSLPPVMITLQRHARSYGYFHAGKFVGRGRKAVTHELALNPDHFGRDDRAILSTLLHEMVHIWQEEHGKPPRRAYHDRQWAAKMKDVGLQPSDTGAPGGKETGQRVTHYVIVGGPFDRQVKQLAAAGFALRWQSRTEAEKEKTKSRSSKTKYTCHSCGANAWAKPDSQLICGECYEEGEELPMMEAEV